MMLRKTKVNENKTRRPREITSSVKGRKDMKVPKNVTATRRPREIKSSVKGRNIKVTHVSQVCNIPQIKSVLVSLGGYPGIGKKLSHLLEKHKKSCDEVAAFLLFVQERQCIWMKRSSGRKAPFTTNQVMSAKWFTNIYRELDKGTMFFRNHLLNNELRINKKRVNQNLIKKILFKSLVYRLVNNATTFKDFSTIPDVNSWNKFSKFVAKRMRQKMSVFTAAHQNMGLTRFTQTMNFVRNEENLNSISKQLMEAAQSRSLMKCQAVLMSIKNVGKFFAWQVICDLLECGMLGRCTDNQWAMLGPGARQGLSNIFKNVTPQNELQLTRLIRDICALDGENSGFQALGKPFPAFLGHSISLKNVEHALCEFSKYSRSAVGKQGKERAFNPQPSPTKSGCLLCSRTVRIKSKTQDPLCKQCIEIVKKWETDYDFTECKKIICNENNSKMFSKASGLSGKIVISRQCKKNMHLKNVTILKAINAKATNAESMGPASA